MKKKDITSKIAPALFTALAFTSVIASTDFSMVAEISTGISNSFKKGGYIEVGASGGAPSPSILNTVTIDSPTPDDNPDNNYAEVSDYLCYKSDISVEYKASAIVSNTTSLTSVEAGGIINYTAVITNNGPSTVTQMSLDMTYDETVIADPIDYAISDGYLASNNYYSMGVNSRKMELLFIGLNLAPSQSITVTYSADVLGGATGNVSTILNVQPTGPETDDSNCSMQDPITTNNENLTNEMQVLTIADLAINKSSSDPATNGFGFGSGSNSSTGVVGKVRSGANVTYTMSIVNNGPSVANSDIVITDTYNPTQLQFVPSGSGNAIWNCNNPSPGNIRCVRTTSMINGETDAMPIIFKVIAQS
jgi:uncharacterized repeat protein (TIGR01451 family)